MITDVWLYTHLEINMNDATFCVFSQIRGRQSDPTRPLQHTRPPPHLCWPMTLGSSSCDHSLLTMCHVELTCFVLRLVHQPTLRKTWVRELQWTRVAMFHDQGGARLWRHQNSTLPQSQHGMHACLRLHGSDSCSQTEACTCLHDLPVYRLVCAWQTHEIM